MTVKITKPALNLREELADLRKPSGIAGEALLRADSVQEQRDLIGAGRKNLIINGGFDVWQRGTSQTTSGYGSVDRWRCDTDGSFTASKTEDIVNGKKVATISSVASGQTYHVLQQRIEFLRRFQGRVLTLSGWIKGSVGTYTQYIEFRDAGGTSITNETFDTTYTGSWQFVEHTFVVPTNASFDNDSSWFNVAFYGGASLALSDVQLELGSVATEFEHRSYGEELALCQRYYTILKNQSASTAHALSYFGAYLSTRGFTSLSLPTTLRGEPTVTYNGFHLQSRGLSTKTIASANHYSFVGSAIILDINTSTTMTAGSSYQAALSPSGYIAFDAEL